MHSESNVVIGILVLIQKISQERSDFASYNITGSGLQNLLDDDDDEHISDAQDSDMSDTEKKVNYKKKSEIVQEPIQKNGEFSYQNLTSQYDPFKREPIYSGARNSLYYEILYFLEHYHPTVRKLAEAIVEEKTFAFKSLVVGGNPLQDFSNNAFLNRLLLEKPRKRQLYRKQNLIKRGKVGKYAYEEPFNVKDLQIKSSSSTSENFIRKYFENKVNRLSYLEKREQKKTRISKSKNTGDDQEVDEEQEKDLFTDKLFEKELAMNEGRKQGESDNESDINYDGSGAEDEDFSDDEVDIDQNMIDKSFSDSDGEDLLDVDDFDKDVMAGDFALSEDEEGDGKLGKRGKFNKSNQKTKKGPGMSGLKKSRGKKKVKK